MLDYVIYNFFFFQAEDGIRDHCVTGVQTCALPISPDVVLTPPFHPTQYGAVGEAYYAKLTPGGGGFAYSASLGPSAFLNAVSVDADGALYVAGGVGAPQPIFDGGLPSCNRNTLIDDLFRVRQGGAFVAVVRLGGLVAS